MKKSLLLLTAAISIFTINTTFAADTLKIGVVDMNQVLQKAPMMTALNDNLIKTFKPRQDDLNTAKQNLQNEIDQLSLKAASMSADDQAKLQDKILTDRAAVDVATANLQRDLTIAKNASLQKFTARLTAAINKIAQDGQYDLIQQRTNIPYVNTKLDITDQVIHELG